ncbi:hypothetical protein HYT23_06110 [Candidatus Pacearchaeota archaeon]|nr:hypothetical protein [Candidatus Pacearchaeota archaeon]
MEKVRDHCGFGVTHTLHDAYSFGKSLQHRGRDAAGIVAKGESRIDVLKWIGGVERFDVTDLHKLFPSDNYHTYLVHTRYATKGRKDKLLDDAHPHVVGGKAEFRGDHVIFLDCDAAIVHNGQVSESYFRDLDKEYLKTDCDSEALLHLFLKKGPAKFLEDVKGAYTMAVAKKKSNSVLVLRDRTGIKPGVIGWKDGKYGAASEDIVFRKNGGHFIEDLQPGAFYTIFPDSRPPECIKVVEPELAFDFFEWNYIADADSVINGVAVRRVRELLGEGLAEEFKEDADLVTYVPRCPETASRSFARKKQVLFKPIFYKMREERSFQGPTSEEREESISQNLFLVPSAENILRGKRVAVIEDSFVRGNVAKRIFSLLENSGAVEINVLSYTPPVGVVGSDGIARGCLFGVDMPPNDDFLAREGARNRTIEEISRKIGGEKNFKISYLSLDGMLRAFEKAGMPRKNLCTYCLGGCLPF